jgi:hypothetical protein
LTLPTWRISSDAGAPPRLGKLQLDAPLSLDQGLQPHRHVFRPHLQGRRRLLQQIGLVADILFGRGTSQRLDAAHARRDRALAHDLEQADVAGAPRVGATAQLDGISLAALAAHRQHAHLVAVLLAEQRHGAGRDRLLGRHQPRLDRTVEPNALVDLVFDPAQFGRRDRLGMADVEA